MSKIVALNGSNCGAPIPVRIGRPLALPVYLARIPAGFPSPAEDFEDAPLDLNERYIKRPAATYFIRVTGHSMVGAGIHDGDLLIVDRSVKPVPGCIVVAAVNGELTVKRLMQKQGEYYLKAENPVYPAIRFGEGTELRIWGVVQHVIHSVNKA